MVSLKTRKIDWLTSELKQLRTPQLLAWVEHQQILPPEISEEVGLRDPDSPVVVAGVRIAAVKDEEDVVAVGIVEALAAAVVAWAAVPVVAIMAVVAMEVAVAQEVGIAASMAAWVTVGFGSRE
jgi:hypothetical protein